MPLEVSTVSYLPKEICKEIEPLRQLISKKFNTKRTLDCVPHITIADRVSIPDGNINKIIKELTEICQRTEAIKIETSGLGFMKLENTLFKHPYLLFIKLHISLSLHKLHDHIQKKVYRELKFSGLKWKEYNPHITLAYSDFTFENFNKAKKYFENKSIPDYSFYLDNLQLIHEKGGKLKSFKSFKFRK